jgi:hypothetical protein
MYIRIIVIFNVLSLVDYEGNLRYLGWVGSDISPLDEAERCRKSQGRMMSAHSVVHSVWTSLVWRSGGVKFLVPVLVRCMEHNFIWWLGVSATTVRFLPPFSKSRVPSAGHSLKFSQNWQGNNRHTLPSNHWLAIFIQIIITYILPSGQYPTLDWHLLQSNFYLENCLSCVSEDLFFA